MRADGFRLLEEANGKAMLIDNPEMSMAPGRVGKCLAVGLNGMDGNVFCARPEGHDGIHAAFWWSNGLAVHSTWLRS